MAVWAVLVTVSLAVAFAVSTGLAAQLVANVSAVNIAEGGAAHVSGNDVTKIVHRNDGQLSVSGNSNIVTVDGHCASVTVSRNDNAVVVDSADSITLAGIDGTVTSHSGSPKISNHGISNTATQG